MKRQLGGKQRKKRKLLQNVILSRLSFVLAPELKIVRICSAEENESKKKVLTPEEEERRKAEFIRVSPLACILRSSLSS